MYYIRSERMETVYDETAFELFGETMSCDHWRRDYGPYSTEYDAWEKMKEESGERYRKYRDSGMECRVSESAEKGEITLEIRDERSAVTEITYTWSRFEDRHSPEPASERWEDLLADTRRKIGRRQISI